ncbi:hypothetical protein J3369_21930, partial [Alteromonas sp. NFXS44]|uniref:hypothetical protein n=1 Tax=Alteromonas sp. NFXS44 TaxID=2818435 RepID=UPI0032DF3DB3
LAEELKTPGARKDLSFAIYQLATVMRDTDGPKAAKPLFVKYEQLMRALAEELKTPGAWKDLANANYYLATVMRDTNGPEAAKPLFVKYEQLVRALAEELKTPSARMELAKANFHLATVTQEAEGAEEAEHLFIKSRKLAKAVVSQLKNPFSLYQFNLLEFFTCQNRQRLMQNNHVLFDSVVLNPKTAEQELDALLIIEKKIDKYAELKQLSRFEVVNVVRIKNVIAACYIATEKTDFAKDKLNQLSKYIERLSQFNTHSAKEQLILASFYEAQVAITTHDFTAADVSFKSARKLVNKMLPDFWDVPYYHSLICWYYSNFLYEKGKYEAAMKEIGLGLAAAQQFTKYNVRNGKDILAVFTETQRNWLATAKKNSL